MQMKLRRRSKTKSRRRRNWSRKRGTVQATEGRGGA